MRALALVFIGIAGWLAVALPSRAADAPAIVIPGKAGVPVIINGVDASYCVVEGDWGLARPGHVPQTIVACQPTATAPAKFGSYFPVFGRRPGYGRYEIEPPPNRQLPPPAGSYYREWRVQSDQPSAIIDPTVNCGINIAPPIAPRDREFC